MNRYEILIGKPLPPPEPEPPPSPVREIIIGSRGKGKTFELVNCIRKRVDKENVCPVVGTYHKDVHIRDVLGEYQGRVRLVPGSALDIRHLCGVREFYFDDIDLVRGYSRYNTPNLKELSERCAFDGKEEVIVTCDTIDICRYLEIGKDRIPYKVQVGRDLWDIVEVPRQDRSAMYNFSPPLLY